MKNRNRRIVGKLYTVLASFLFISMVGLTSPVSAERYYIPWLDNSVSGTGVALSNEDGTDKDVTIRVYDPTGTIVDVEDVTIPANGKRSFLVASGYTGQGSIEIDSPDGTLTNIALEGMRDEKVLLSVGTTEGFCHNLINHIAVSSQWDSNLKLSNPTDVTVAYTLTFIDTGGETYASFTGSLAPRASENIDVRTLLETQLGTVDEATGKIRIDADNPLAAILTYNDFDAGNLNIASVKAAPYAGDYTLGPGVVAVDSQMAPTVFYAAAGSADSWVEFPGTFSVLNGDGTPASLAENRLDLSGIGEGEALGYMVETHAGHQRKLLFIGDTPAAINSYDNNLAYATTAGFILTATLTVSETDMSQGISKVEHYRGSNLNKTYSPMPRGIVIPAVAFGTANYTLVANSSAGSLVLFWRA